MDLATILPPRSVDDIVAQRVRLRVDGQDYLLPVLRIADNEDWKRKLDAEMAALLGRATDEDDPGSVLTALAVDTAPFLDLLYLYDRHGLLPDRETIRAAWTETDLLCAVLEVWRAANPLVDIGIEVWSVTTIATAGSARRTRRWRRSTAGPSPASVAN